MKRAFPTRVPELELDLTYAARRPWVPRRAQFAQWVQAALDAGSRGNVIAIRVVGDGRSRSLNARYRGKDKPTNVLSFHGAGPTPDGRRHWGELIICAPVVSREAAAQGKGAAAHWAHLTVHGTLHLRGFDHEKPAEARKMESREIQILDRLGFSNPYV